MDLVCKDSNLRGKVQIPGSKSHTIRAVAIGALAAGQSEILQPLESHDTSSAVNVYRAFGADISVEPGKWLIRGLNGSPQTPEDVIDVGNSGTTLNVGLGTASLLQTGLTVMTGDAQIRRRPSGALARALNDLGARVDSTRGNGCAPFVISGTLVGGETRMEALSSQYLTSLLINAPLAEGESHISVPVLHEQPYVWMTLDWLRRQGIAIEHDEDLTDFTVPGGQQYTPVRRAIPADFSSATFFLAAGALPDNDVTCLGMDMTDTQGDRAVVDYVRELGAEVETGDNWVRVRARELRGAELNLNATPDALPMMAALACFARGTTRLVNVPQARIKETDRIAVMKQELEKLGAHIEELRDGMVIHEAPLHAAEVNGHADHRVVMALAIAATAIPGETRIHGYEAASVTIPGFVDMIKGLGAETHIIA